MEKGKIDASRALTVLNETLEGAQHAAPQRVAQPENMSIFPRVVDAIPTSINPTASRVIKKAPHTHKNRTRR